MRTGIYVCVFFFFLAQRASQASEKRPHAHPLWCVYTTGPLIVCKGTALFLHHSLVRQSPQYLNHPFQITHPISLIACNSV